MWVHLLILGLIDGAGGEVIPVDSPVNSAGFARLDRGHYKYKYKIPEKAAQIIERVAQQKIANKRTATLQKTFDRLGVVYQESYRQVFIEILAYLEAEKAAQDAEDEQIVHIIAALI
jgi:hypothetical protein